MNSENAHHGYSITIIGIFVAIVLAAITALSLPTVITISLLIWCVFLAVATLLLLNKEKRAFLVGTLKHSRYTQLHTKLITSGVQRIWDSVCAPADKTASGFTLLRAALTWKLYDKALLLAVAYPLWLLIGQWIVSGEAAQLGSFTVIPEADFWPDRTVMLGIIAILTAGLIGRKLASASQRPGVQAAFGWLLWGALAVAVAVAVALAGAFAGAGAFAVAVAGAFAAEGAFALALALAGALALALSGAFAGALAGALAFAGAFGVAVTYLDERGKERLARFLITGVSAIAIWVAAISLDWINISGDQRSLFLFLGVFPLINALFDCVSYGVTLSLIRRGLRARLPVLWGLLDLAIACCLFVLLGFALVVVVHGLNLLAGVPFLDLPTLFAGVYHAPEAHIWLYLMLFSTILPTAIHFSVSLLGLTGIWPRGWRAKFADAVVAAPKGEQQFVWASFVLSLVWTLPTLAIGALVWGLYWVGKPLIFAALQFYFNILLWGAAIPVGAI